MGWIESTISFFGSKTVKMWVKLAIVAVVVIGIVLANNSLGLTYYYVNGQKSEQLVQLTEVLRDTSLSPNERAQVEWLRWELLARNSNFPNNTKLSIDSQTIKQSSVMANAPTSDTGTANVSKYTIENQYGSSKLLHNIQTDAMGKSNPHDTNPTFMSTTMFLCSSGWFLVLSLLSIVFIVRNDKIFNGRKMKLAAAKYVAVAFVIVAVFFALTFSFILPENAKDSSIASYIAVAILHTIIAIPVLVLLLKIKRELLKRVAE